MSVFQLGPILKARREELGLSQEDLADGICSVPTLSRIENGERMPTKNHFEMLMQRLGYSAVSLDFFTDKQDFLVHELKFKIRQAYVDKNYSLTQILMDNLEEILCEPTKIDQQFIILHKTFLNQNNLSNLEKLQQYEHAIRLTCPKYIEKHIPRVLSYDEIILLNNIAICYAVEGFNERAISILTTVKDYYDHHVISKEEALRTQPMILYNLSKYQGLSGQFDECIETCDVAIRMARTTGRCLLLSKTLYNKGWALLRRNQSGDKEAAENALKHAYFVSVTMEQNSDRERIKKLFEETFKKPLSV